MRPLLVLLLAVAMSCATAPAKPPQSQLYREIAAQDAAMFAAFNAHDAEALMPFFSPDVEFYHDKDGLLRFSQVRDSLTRLFSGNTDLTRQLVPGTLAVYPIAGYGAIETGAHRFCHTENGKPDCGTFQFTQIWQKKDGRWVVTRELSYGH